jgi:S1-C subfamily serine protease
MAPRAISFSGGVPRRVVSALPASGRAVSCDDAWFRYFFGDRGQGGPQVGAGSGVIVSAQGYLLTNDHVVEGASEIEVRLADGREAKATLVGTDPETDVAVLKVDLERLPSITLGNVEALQVGDLVLAIGNPFNVGQTVTAGIVSALGRNQLGLSTFENFIQTDAAINPAIGRCADRRNGQLIGINADLLAIGGSPESALRYRSTWRQVMEGLIKDGKSRG